MTAPVLSVRGLAIEGSGRRIVDGISFDLGEGEILGLVGESGSGKTMACRGLIRLLPAASLRIAAGEVLFQGRDLAALPEAEMRALRGRGIGMIFQDPASHLDPVMRIGEQIGEGLRLHDALSRREARTEAIELLRQVGIPDPTRRIDDYPHQFSGGMRQRAMIAVALACRPTVLIADEPTTALDVTVQAQVLRLLKDIRDRRGLSIILITHDLGVVAQTCDAIAVMYAGRICERGPARALLRRPLHPYTAGLLACQPAARGTGLLTTIPGQPPSLDALPPGCRFHPRCGHRIAGCETDEPAIRRFEDGRAAACHAPLLPLQACA
ncbi:ABC transporter ATP-binding protein [Labrys wisconsinensis]|uniref:Oligopeptide/dipeptide ABC transporter ATP-binding protein n=1 Tax=Labrys wisconsinensis TaxID=425677 RepID=A0ABU0JJ95_9HYPH|nr:ABC transporter ATP-binding protein [Labrys wisconsinensis]MDQ0474354.1 oligopeptide/dipeptide ABC transporter ATP-binding protein [Labrys wisconsinensis]